MTVLDQIVERTRERLRVEEKPDRRAAEEIAQGRAPFAFRAAVSREGVNLIAETNALGGAA